MLGRVLQALIGAGRPAWWLVALVLVIVPVWLLVRYADRLAIAVDRWMQAWDRRAACNAALTAKTSKEREQALAVLDHLDPLPQRSTSRARATND